MRIRHRCPIIAMVLVAVCPLGMSQAGDGQADVKREAQEAVHRLAAIQSMVKFIQSDDLLRIPPSVLASEILAHLSEHRSDNEAVAERVLTEAATRRLGEQVENVSRKADPAGTLGIRKWLGQQMTLPLAGQTESLQNLARRRILEDLGRGGSTLRAAYRLAREETANGQVREALSRLAEDVNKISPSEEEIIQAHKSDAQRAAVERATLARLLGREQGVWLSEAETRLRQKAAELVASGLEQYEEQVKVLQEAEAACFTPEGIRQELTGAVEKSLAATPTPPAPGVRRYGPFFQHGDTMASDETARRVGLKVGSVLESIPAQIPKETPEEIRRRIQEAPKEHHSLGVSLRAFQSKMKVEVEDKVAQKYCERAVQAKQPGDTQERLAGLAGDVLKELERQTSPCQTQWLTLYNGMAGQLDRAHSAIRKDLADKQGGLYCPDLAAGRWRPLEATALQYPFESLDRERLKKLPVWVKAPSADELLLEETWESLLLKARERLQLCSEAMAGQRQCVNAMEQAIEASIRGSAQWDEVAWRQRYTEETTKRWRMTSADTPAGKEYPDLFEEAIQLLNGIIDRVLGTEAGEAQRELVYGCRPRVQEEVDAQTRRRIRTTFEKVLARYTEIVTANWEQHPLSKRNHELLKVAVEAMKAVTQEIVRAQQQALDAPQPLRPQQPVPVPAPRPSLEAPSITVAPPKVDTSPPWERTPRDPRGESERQKDGSREPPLPGALEHGREGGRSDGAADAAQGHDRGLGTGGSATDTNTSDGPDGGAGHGGGTGPGGLLIPFWLVGVGVPIWLLLTVLLLAAAVAVSRRRQARELEMFDRNLASLITRCGGTHAASALLAQMELAQRMLGEYRPDRPVETLSDLRQCSRRLIRQVQSGWRSCPETASLPDLAIEIQQMLVGGVLACAMLGDVSVAG